MHIGVSYRNVNRSNSYYLLGLYNNISLINLSTTLPLLKKKFFFFFKFMLKKYSNFFVIDGILNDSYKENLKQKFISKEISYFFGRWWNGFLKNYKTFIITGWKRDLYLFSEFPIFIFYIPFGEEIDNTSIYTANHEFNSLKINFLIFFDSNKSIKFFNSGIIQNIKTILNNFFLIYLIMAVNNKVLLLRKKRWYLEVFKYFTNFYSKKTFFYFFLDHVDAFKHVFFEVDRFFLKKIRRKDLYYKNKNFLILWKNLLK